MKGDGIIHKASVTMYWLIGGIVIAVVGIAVCYNIFPQFGSEVRDIMSYLLNSGAHYRYKRLS